MSSKIKKFIQDNLNPKKFTKIWLCVLALWFGIFFKSMGLIIIGASLLILVVSEKYLKIKIPLSFTIIFVVFMVLCLLLGSWLDFYEKFPWWDDLLHFSYGIGFSFVGYLIIYIIFQKNNLEDNIGIIILFSFCFTIAVWAMWEIYEFLGDSWWGFNMQSTEIWRWVNDTMHDIILATVASIIVNTYVYLYLKLHQKNWIWKLTDSFLKENK